MTFSKTTDTPADGVPTTCKMRNAPCGVIVDCKLPAPSIVSVLFATPLARSLMSRLPPPDWVRVYVPGPSSIVLLASALESA